MNVGSDRKQASSENPEAHSLPRFKRQRSAPMGSGANPTREAQLAQGFGNQQDSRSVFGTVQPFSRPKNLRSRASSRSARRSTRDRGDAFVRIPQPQLTQFAPSRDPFSFSFGNASENAQVSSSSQSVPGEKQAVALMSDTQTSS